MPVKKDFSDLTVIIPTLNEEGNIGRLIQILTRMYNNVRIIVSDDGSTDQTKKEVMKANATNRRVVFIDHSAAKTKGLTSSVIYAAMKVKTPKVVVMDGDMQHPPKIVGKIAAQLGNNDLCVGVRVKVKNWGLYRMILSKGISDFSYLVFMMRGKPTCNDMMSGFFGIKTSLLKDIISANREGFVMKGYKVLLDILRMAGRDIKIAEVPYSTFHPRKKGKSKLRAVHMVDVLISTFRR
ncbi:MAG: glycosyltransferase [Candidatus Micrarchaeaceae archaeon]